MSDRCSIGVALLFLIACAGCGSSAEPGRSRIVTTSLPVYCLTKNIAGDLAGVENLFPGNVSPHDYQFSPQDTRKLSGARLVITTGLGLEEGLDRVLKGHRRPRIDAAAGLGTRRIASDDNHVHSGHSHEHWNPHFWLDPTLAAHAVTNILRALQEIDPANGAGYESNANAYVSRLHKLDEEIRTGLAPHKGSAIVTYHDAFPYFARRYQLEIVGVIEPKPDVDPSPRHLSELRKTIREKNVRVLFTERDEVSRLAERIREDFKVQLAPLDPLESGELTPTAYEDGMRRNLEVLKKVFDASVP
jgi:zinc transport system substrate-binding protein